MSQTMPFAPINDEADMPGSVSLTQHCIKRVGQRPLKFDGVELCMAMSFVPGCRMWFEINVFRANRTGFAVSVKHFYRDENEQDIARAWECSDFESVMTMLETYDPAHDLRIDLDPADEKLALPDLAAKSLAVRAAAGEARRQYASLVGEILADLEAGAA